jgi:hypothetical protein
MQYTLELGKIPYRGARNPVTVDINLEIITPSTTDQYLDTNLRPITEPVTQLLMTGRVYNFHKTKVFTSGQISCLIRKYFPTNPDVIRLCEFWDRYHDNLNNTTGTAEQNEVLAQFTPKDPMHFFVEACDYLEGIDLLDVPIPEKSRQYFKRNKETGELPTMYRYGSAWLHNVIPTDVIDEIQYLISQFNK